jgi:predicted dehydrogenase
MAGWHAERWRQLPVELRGFYTPTAARAEQQAREHGGQAFTSLDELLAEVDVVDVCTPTSDHRQPVIAAAAAGKHIVCEKPLARHIVDAQAMIDACAAAGVRLFVAQVVRFFPEFVRAKEVLDSGELGKVGVVRTVRGGSFPRPLSWYGNFERSGGVILDLAIHDIDYLRWLCGEVTRVFARGLTFAGVPATDHVLLTLRFASGAIGHVEASWAYPPGNFRTFLEIAGDEGLLQFDSLASPLTLTMPQDPGAPAGEVTIPGGLLAPEDDPYYRELKHFLDCLDRGDDFLVAPEDGLEALRIALAAIESERTGQPVELAGWEEPV